MVASDRARSTAVDGMADITQSLAVQHQIVKNFQEKLNFFDEKLEVSSRHNLEGRLALKEELDDHKETFKETYETICKDDWESKKNEFEKLKIKQKP